MKARFMLFVPNVTDVAMCLCHNDTEKKFHEMENGLVVYKNLYCTNMQIIENDGKALAIISTDLKHGEIMVQKLKDEGSVIPLGCEDGVNRCHRERPSMCFTESEWGYIEQIIPDVDRSNFIGDIKK